MLAAMETTALLSLATRWLDAFNAKELPALLDLYEDDAVHLSPKLRDQRPETRGEIRGKDALRAWWSDAMARLPGLRYEPEQLTAMGERVFMEYVRKNPGDADLRVAEVLIVSERGKIRASRVYHG